MVAGTPVRTKRVAKRRKTTVAARRPPRLAVKSSLKDFNYFDQTIGSGSVGTTPVYQTLFFPSQGSTATSRYGDRTITKAIRGQFKLSPGATQDLITVTRVILFWDNQPNATNPSSPLPLAASSVYAMPNPDYRFRFTILRDWIIPTQPQSVNMTGCSSDSNQDFIQRYYIKNLDYVSQFIGNAGSVADIASGALCMFFLTDSNTAGKIPQVDGVSRCIFTS